MKFNLLDMEDCGWVKKKKMILVDPIQQPLYSQMNSIIIESLLVCLFIRLQLIGDSQYAKIVVE